VEVTHQSCQPRKKPGLVLFLAREMKRERSLSKMASWPHGIRGEGQGKRETTRKRARRRGETRAGRDLWHKKTRNLQKLG